MNRRKALTALAVGVVAPARWPCAAGRDKRPGAAADPAVDDIRARRRHRRVSPTAPVGLEVQRMVPARHADQRRGQGRRGRAEPRPHRVHHHRTARLRRRVHLGRLGGRPRRQGRTGRRATSPRSTRANQVNGQFQLADGQIVGVAAPIILQFDASIDDGQGGRRAGADGHHRPAGRGQLGVAARRGRRLARALAHPRVLPGRHQGPRRRPAVRRAVRRRRLRRSRLHARLRDRSLPAGQGRGVVAPIQVHHRRGRDHGLSRAATARATWTATSPAAASTWSPRSTKTST